MKQKTRILIYILIAIAVVIMGSIAILSNQQTEESPSAQEHLDLGRIYLTDLSYDKAVVEFTEAVNIEPSNPDAYLGLAEAYEGAGDTDKAADVLEEGYEKTGDEWLKEKLDEIKLPVTETSVTTAETTSVTTTVMTEETTTTVSTVSLVAVPNLAGLSEEDAVAACENVGLNYSISYANSDSVAKGYVMSQTIPENANVVEGVSVPFTVCDGAKVVTTVTTADKKMYYAEDFLGMTFKESFQILGKGELSAWNGGYGYYWKDLGLELTAYQNEVIFNYPEEPIIPEEAHIGLVYTWSEKIPANKDLKIGMKLIDVVYMYDLSESDIHTSEMRFGYYLSIYNKYNYHIDISTSGENDYNEPITEIVLQMNDYYDRS